MGGGGYKCQLSLKISAIYQFQILGLNGRYFPTNSFIALSVSGLISSEGSGRIKLTFANSVLVLGTRQ